jgi:hypothetical protein
MEFYISARRKMSEAGLCTCVKHFVLLLADMDMKMKPVIHVEKSIVALFRLSSPLIVCV